MAAVLASAVDIATSLGSTEEALLDAYDLQVRSVDAALSNEVPLGLIGGVFFAVESH
jgi:hypothetical protein